MSFQPPSTIDVSRHHIPAWGRIPNTSIQNKPLLIYHSAFKASAPQLSAHLKEVAVVVPQWRYTMYRQSHFHSTSHEVLGVVSGRARLCFGGEENPGRAEPVVEEGDLIVVPAGVAHHLLEDLDGNFAMLGSYPTGKNWDMCYGVETEDEDDIKENILQQSWFDQDPLYGKDGPAIHV
ncbi:RmlC-like cupin domain-containing protein [Talaromyces proteolyticus]|uniref:RmlC-like cupin domain-containing protein n=1 Tax=Talaromyces proteolyticus TaxID=1131652 RepID=A0AAD4KWF9_9EURO|nr:RmlC-like cupin domain-containing protein [Talaromyces proteolyticus]KAH8698452.1 RmlC-like cupin domain-containing protein [Talaromyces proteolyticus]